MNKKNLLIYITIPLFIVALIIVSTSVFSNKDVVASVNGEKITKEELYESLVQQNGQQALDLLISEKIIGLESKNNNISVTEAELNQEIEAIKEEYGGEESLLAALEYSNMSLEELKKNIELNILIEKLLGSSITISQEEIEEYFEMNKDSFTIGEEEKEPNLEDNEEKIREIILAQKVQSEFDPWLQEKYDLYQIESFL